MPGSARMEGLGGTSGKEPDLRSQGTFSPRFPSCHRPSQTGHQRPWPAVLPSDQGCGWKQEVWGLTWLSLVPRAPAQPWKRVPCERPALPHVLDAPGLLCALRAGVRSGLRTFPSPPRKSVPTEPPASWGLSGTRCGRRGSPPPPFPEAHRGRGGRCRSGSWRCLSWSSAEQVTYREPRARRPDRRPGREGPGSVAHGPGSS